MKFATALTLFAASSAIKLELSKDFTGGESTEEVLATQTSELHPIQRYCALKALAGAVEEYGLAPEAARKLGDDLVQYIAADKSLAAIVEELLLPLAVAGGMTVQEEEEALEAILGYNSAHSLAIGPEIADPFISPLGLIMTPALSSK